jgi:hypothetical protein
MGDIQRRGAPKMSIRIKPRVERVIKLSQEWLGQTFVAKNEDYGDSYILTGKTVDLWFPDGVVLDTPLKKTYFGLLTRMLDKLIRTSNIVLRGTVEKVQDERAYQTIADNGVYSFMAAEILLNGVDQ